jgi:hypothetical protein
MHRTLLLRRELPRVPWIAVIYLRDLGFVFISTEVLKNPSHASDRIGIVDRIEFVRFLFMKIR